MKAKKLPSGNYRVQVVDGYNSNGKRLVKSFTAETEWEALKMADDYKRGRYKKPTNVTVQQALDAYIDSRDNILSPSTIYGYERIRNTRLQLISHIKLSDLTILDVQRAVNHDAKRLSRKSIKSALALLKSAMNLYDEDINIGKLTLPQAKSLNRNIPSATELLKVIIGSDIELPCLLAMWLSLRMSEVRGLQFRDVSKDGKHIYINRSRLCLHGNNVLRVVNKTELSTRVNPLPKYLYDKILAIPHKHDTDFIVPTSYEMIRRTFRKLMDDNGFDISFHTLRHEFASTLNDLGVPSNYIQKLGGWSTDDVMKRVYTHTNEQKEKDYQEIIDNYFSESIQNITQKSHDFSETA